MIDYNSPNRSSSIREREEEVGLNNIKDEDIDCEEIKEQEEVKMTSRFLVGVTHSTSMKYIGLKNRICGNIYLHVWKCLRHLWSIQAIIINCGIRFAYLKLQEKAGFVSGKAQRRIKYANPN